MQLTLCNILPQHLQDKSLSASAIWGKQVVLQQGCRVFVQAPSGAGKTTLMHILYGLRSDYAGTLSWGNTQPPTANDETLSQLRTNDISIIFQDLRLFPQLSAWENIMVKAQLTNTTGDEQVAQWMDRLGILHKRDALASTMSYGEQQRTVIVRALVQPFKWLLMDEPFSHLDGANRNNAIALMADVLQQRNAGMIYADLDSNNYFPYTQTLTL